jgi:hypothetical protein
MHLRDAESRPSNCTSNGEMMYEAEFISTGKDGGNNHERSSFDPQHPPGAGEVSAQELWEVPDARPLLPKAAFFMGDLRDGLPMVRFLLRHML